MRRRALPSHRAEEVRFDSEQQDQAAAHPHQGLIAGIPKRINRALSLVNGTTYTAAAAVALLQGRVTAATNAATSRAAYTAAVKAADAADSATAATVSGLVEAIYVAFGEDPAALADFGLPARKKPAPLTPRAAPRGRGQGEGHPRRAAHHGAEGEARHQGDRPLGGGVADGHDPGDAEAGVTG